jgi:predicted metal-dependent hydrolase
MLQLSLDLLYGLRGLRGLNKTGPARPSRTDRTLVWKSGVIVHVVHRPRARRYLLSVQADGSARLVIPRRGSESEGMRFLERSETWLIKRLAQWRSQSHMRLPWLDGTRFLFRGEETELGVETAASGARLTFADQSVTVPRELPDYRDAVLRHLRQLAKIELPPRTRELAQFHGITVQRVTVRAQKSRWGSCSVRGTISLNWRLIQTPAFVADYIIVHELMHRRQMNHSARYWKLVAEAFPDYQRAEKWLKGHHIDLRD